MGFGGLRCRMLDDKRYIHHMTGDGWKTYPTYDLTYCRCDNFQCITHSLCATEFDLSRVSYEWLCDRLGVPRLMLVLDPMVRVVNLLLRNILKISWKWLNCHFSKVLPMAYVLSLLLSYYMAWSPSRCNL